MSDPGNLSDLIRQAENTADAKPRPKAQKAPKTPKARASSAGSASTTSSADLDALIGAGVAHLNHKNPPAYQNEAASGSSRKVGAGETAMDADSSAGAGLDGLVQQAARSVGGGRTAPAKPDASARGKSAAPAAISDISQLITHAAGGPAPTLKGETANQAPSLEAHINVATPDNEAKSGRSAQGVTPRNVGRWAVVFLLGLLIGGGGWFGYKHLAPPASPINSGPPFPLTAKQKELVEPLRAAQAEVERYRKANGRLPTRIELKARGVQFYIRPVKDSYMIFAVSEHQNLVLMGNGSWYKAK